jgi:hypothetical protein
MVQHRYPLSSTAADNPDWRIDGFDLECGLLPRAFRSSGADGKEKPKPVRLDRFRQAKWIVFVSM